MYNSVLIKERALEIVEAAKGYNPESNDDYYDYQDDYYKDYMTKDEREKVSDFRSLDELKHYSFNNIVYRIANDIKLRWNKDRR